MKPEDLSYEDAVSELESIVDKMEKGDLSLDEALKSFERGIKLAQTSQEKLKNAEQKVQILLTQNGNEQLAPFSQEDSES